MLYVALRGIDNLKMLFTPFLPLQLADAARAARLRRRASPGRSSSARSRRRAAAARRADRRLRRAGSGAGQPSELAAGQALREPRPLFREARPRAGRRGRARADGARRRSVIDTHAHLDALEEPDGRRSRARARRASTRVDHDRDRDRLVPARARARRAARRRLRRARDRPAPGRRATRRSASTSCASCSTTRRRSRSARPGSTTTTAPTRSDEQRRLFEAQLALAAELGLPVVDPHPRRRRRHGGDARAATTAPSSCTASPSRGCSRPALERGWYFSFAGNVDLPEGRRSSARRPRPSRPTGSSPRRTARTSRRSPSAAGRTSRRTSSTRSRRSPRPAARTPTSSPRRIDANARAAFGLP